MRRNIPHDDESGAFGLAFMGISPLSLALYFCSPCKRLRRAIHRLLSANSVTKMGVPPWPGYAPWPAPACAGWRPWACSCPAHRLTRAHDHMPLGSDALRIFALGHTLVTRIGKRIGLRTMEQLASLRHAVDVGGRARHGVHPSAIGLCTDVAFHSKGPLQRATDFPSCAGASRGHVPRPCACPNWALQSGRRPAPCLP